MKIIVPQSEPDLDLLGEAPLSAKKDAKNDFRAKKKGDSKPETDASTIVDDVKPYVYQWKSITADGQVHIQNPTTQEYEKAEQLRLILETNPKTNEVIQRKII